ncbi:hypothetical protein [Phenylobacterium sp.]|uniref:hypothetical protein n=1 Tax=Phenylobacterium sp. TaxID=1871053 RepID=UPI0035AE28C2
MRYSEIISEYGGLSPERKVRARGDIAAAHAKQAEASRRYQDALRSADQRLKSTRQNADAAQSKKQQAAQRYQNDLKAANERIARASRSLAQSE